MKEVILITLFVFSACLAHAGDAENPNHSSRKADYEYDFELSAMPDDIVIDWVSELDIETKKEGTLWLTSYFENATNKYRKNENRNSKRTIREHN